ncbi:MAG: hypothetical protein HQL48_05805 [Gammaproteobacteria bacterium]|nr:hypothetical protein [Gammaproteobacteria bacterium]
MYPPFLPFIAIIALTAGFSLNSAAATEPPSPASQNTTTLPQRGLHQQQVLRRFGPPQQRVAAVGSPPIIRWSYAGYTVYFEGEFVIHSVPDSVYPPLFK